MPLAPTADLAAAPTSAQLVYGLPEHTPALAAAQCTCTTGRQAVSTVRLDLRRQDAACGGIQVHATRRCCTHSAAPSKPCCHNVTHAHAAHLPGHTYQAPTRSSSTTDRPTNRPPGCAAAARRAQRERVGDEWQQARDTGGTMGTLPCVRLTCHLRPCRPHRRMPARALPAAASAVPAAPLPRVLSWVALARAPRRPGHPPGASASCSGGGAQAGKGRGGQVFGTANANLCHIKDNGSSVQQHCGASPAEWVPQQASKAAGR